MSKQQSPAQGHKQTEGWRSHSHQARVLYLERFQREGFSNQLFSQPCWVWNQGTGQNSIPYFSCELSKAFTSNWVFSKLAGFHTSSTLITHVEFPRQMLKRKEITTDQTCILIMTSAGATSSHLLLKNKPVDLPPQKALTGNLQLKSITQLGGVSV